MPDERRPAMGRAARTLIFATACGAGAVATRAVLNRRSPRRAGAREDARHQRWHTITVNRDIAEVTTGDRLPQPLADLSGVEVRFRPAPGDRGTEIAVRLLAGEPAGAATIRNRVAGDDPRYAVRRALRETRSLLETGDVLLPDAPATTRRTIRNTPLEHATRHGREEGLL
ncbi:hypothetical protein [Actinoplanes sp. NPDC026623]|uniref:hypothetical protein n=1 Tax=Actinoplanes sp. NPDC026623 TaxID=3155610 RepID=UPI0033D908CB